MTEPRTRVLLVLSNQVQADAISVVLSSTFNCEVFKAALEPRDTMVDVREHSPSVVVVSGDFGEKDSWTFVESAASHARVIVLSSEQNQYGPAEMIDAVEAGALGYLSALASFDEIGRAVLSAANERATVPPGMLADLLRHVIRRHRASEEMADKLDVLTPREAEVFRLLAEGLDKAGIAEVLFISPETVRTHIQRIMQKLGARSRADLVALAARSGLEVGIEKRTGE